MLDELRDWLSHSPDLNSPVCRSGFVCLVLSPLCIHSNHSSRNSNLQVVVYMLCDLLSIVLEMFQEFPCSFVRFDDFGQGSKEVELPHCRAEEEPPYCCCCCSWARTQLHLWDLCRCSCGWTWCVHFLWGSTSFFLQPVVEPLPRTVSWPDVQCPLHISAHELDCPEPHINNHQNSYYGDPQRFSPSVQHGPCTHHVSHIKCNQAQNHRKRSWEEDASPLPRRSVYGNECCHQHHSQNRCVESKCIEEEEDCGNCKAWGDRRTMVVGGGFCSSDWSYGCQVSHIWDQSSDHADETDALDVNFFLVLHLLRSLQVCDLMNTTCD